MAIDTTELKELKGKRITIDGERHRVAKVAIRAGIVTTDDGTEVAADGIYKRGRGYFFDTPKKGKKAATTPKAKADDAPAETARQRRRREKREAAEAEAGASTGGRRARSKKAAEPEEPAPSGRKKATASKGTGEVAVPSKKKKMLEAFNQQTAERISTESFDLLGRALADHGTYAVGPVAVGASYTEDAIKVTITLMPTSKSEKEIKAYIRDHREATDVAPDDDEDDDSLDDDLEDDDVDDDAEEEDEDDSELEEDEDEDDDADEEDEEEESEEDDESEDLTVDDMVGAITDLAPSLKAAKVQSFVEAYLASDEIEDKFGDDMVPGVTKLQVKGGGTEFLLVGYDEEEEQVKLLNLDSLKFRSKTIAEVARMEVVEEEESEEEDDGVDD